MSQPNLDSRFTNKIENKQSSVSDNHSIKSDQPYSLDNLFFNTSVQYKCSCNHYRRFYSNFFCRHCLVLKCRECVAHEVDSQYCQHCLEYIPTIDPKFQKNKCPSCYQCPSCQNLLTNTVVGMAIPKTSQESKENLNPSQPVQPRKSETMNQLICAFCRWSSDTFVVSEANQPISGLPDIEVSHLDRITSLISYFNSKSQKEKCDKDKKRFPHRTGTTMDLLAKYGISKSFSPKLFESLRQNQQDKTIPKTKYDLEKAINRKDETTLIEIEPSIALKHDQIEPIDPGYYDNNFNIEEFSTLEQRLAQIEIQPSLVEKFYPISKSLSLKRSLRCKECERNLCKSEYSPVSIKFKIQSSAYYHVPEIKLNPLFNRTELKQGVECLIGFTIQNQTTNSVSIKVATINSEENSSYQLYLSPNKYTLGPKDDTLDLSVISPKDEKNSDDSFVYFQKVNKIGLYMKVVPLERTSNLLIDFVMEHDVIILQGPREADRTENVTQMIRFSVGQVN